MLWLVTMFAGLSLPLALGDAALQSHQTVSRTMGLTGNWTLPLTNLPVFSIQPRCMTVAEVAEALGLQKLRSRQWHIQGTCATKGEGLYEGLDWLASTLKKMQSSGAQTSVPA